MKTTLQIVVEHEDLETPLVEEVACFCRGIIKSCGLAKEKGWRILVGEKTYEAVRSRKENTPCAKIPHSLITFEPKFI